MPDIETGSCKFCFTPFYYPPSARHKKFCSKICRDAYHAGQRELASSLLEKYNQEKEDGLSLDFNRDHTA